MRQLIVFLVFIASSAQAESARQAMFPRESSCYQRHYSKDHLAKHPDQLVTDIAIGPMADQTDSDILVLDVTVKQRGNPEVFVGNAYCETALRGLRCGMEGDAGSFNLAPAKGGAVLLVVSRDGMSFEGNSGFITLEGRSGDDREFLMPAGACP